MSCGAVSSLCLCSSKPLNGASSQIAFIFRNGHQTGDNVRKTRSLSLVKWVGKVNQAIAGELVTSPAIQIWAAWTPAPSSSCSEPHLDPTLEGVVFGAFDDGGGVGQGERGGLRYPPVEAGLGFPTGRIST